VFDIIENTNRGVPIKAWIRGVQLEASASEQLINIASLPFVFNHVAVMPDVHFGIGATVGSVIATKHAIIPAAVGVDIGCGMTALHTTLKASDLPDSLSELRSKIEQAVPHGRSEHGGVGDIGAFQTPQSSDELTLLLVELNVNIISKYPNIERASKRVDLQIGTLGTGNHFIEICLDESQDVWIMLHSGSRGIGNRIGTQFIELAKQDMRRWFINLPDANLAYIPEGSELFNDYCNAVDWAQRYALLNRKTMLNAVANALAQVTKPFVELDQVIDCHHNYVSREHHFGQNVIVTRKGAVSAKVGQLGIIPGSMGVQSFIVRGKGNRESFMSCSHGAGRRMSRTEARKRFTVEDHIEATKGVECRKDESVIDETPMAYKDIDAVMAAQDDLVEVVHTLKQVLCVKG
jgi:tRNA-splicing ligase RtcB